MGPPRPPVSSTTVSTSPARTAHSLSLLTEYTHSLDSFPLDLSRNFADLRELDAVLSSSMTAVTNKVLQLTEMIERKHNKEDRLYLLADIADEVSKLKPGADDKIRVACHAADSLRGHQSHMTNLLDHIPEQEYGTMAGMLSRKTVYPHVAQRSYVPSGALEGGRRQRRPATINGHSVDATPNKRRRVVPDDGDSLVKSPSKPRTGESSRARNGARKKYVACYSTPIPYLNLRVEPIALPHQRSLYYPSPLISLHLPCHRRYPDRIRRIGLEVRCPLQSNAFAVRVQQICSSMIATKSSATHRLRPILPCPRLTQMAR